MSSKLSNEEKASHVLNITDQPIVVFDGLLMQCSICKQKFIPEECLDFEDLIQSLKDRLVFPTKSPDYQSESRPIRTPASAVKTRHYQSFYKNRLRSDGDNCSDDDFCASYSARTKERKTSSTSNGIPNSVLLQITPRKNSHCCIHREENAQVFDDGLQILKSRLVDQINWVKERGEDYVALETLNDIEQVVTLIRVFMESKTPAALGFKINQNHTITISYQFLKNFSTDFMMLKVGENYRVFMEPF